MTTTTLNDEPHRPSRWTRVLHWLLRRLLSLPSLHPRRRSLFVPGLHPGGSPAPARAPALAGELLPLLIRKAEMCRARDDCARRLLHPPPRGASPVQEALLRGMHAQFTYTIGCADAELRRQPGLLWLDGVNLEAR
jgi:hypothetical protein